MENNARFKLENARITRVNERPKVCFLTVMCQAGKYPNYYDVVAFQAPTFPLEEGMAVNISGELSKRKPKEGSRDWTVELIARKFEKGDDAKAPVPKRSGERQHRDEAPADDDTLF